MESKTWYAVAGISTILNVVVSIYLARRDDLETFQKDAQLFIAWLIPYFGAIGLWLFYISEYDDKPNGGSLII